MMLSELLFSEAMITLSKLESEGLALVSPKAGRLVLVEPTVVNSLWSRRVTRESDYVQAIVGTILVVPWKTVRGTEVYEVQSSAAKKGYGPILYELVMSNHWLTSDKGSVSKQAKAVWQKFYEREDVWKLYLYPPELDKIDKTDPTNYAYKLKNPLNSNRLVANGRRINGEMLPVIRKASRAFFTDMFSGRQL